MMKIVKTGDPELIRKMNVVTLTCAICGAEYEMERKEYYALLGSRQDCEFCGSKEVVEKKLRFLNEG